METIPNWNKLVKIKNLIFIKYKQQKAVAKGHKMLNGLFNGEYNEKIK